MVLMGSVVEILISTVFKSIYNEFSGELCASRNLIGNVNNQEDRLTKVENDNVYWFSSEQAANSYALEKSIVLVT